MIANQTALANQTTTVPSISDSFDWTLLKTPGDTPKADDDTASNESENGSGSDLSDPVTTSTQDEMLSDFDFGASAWLLQPHAGLKDAQREFDLALASLPMEADVLYGVNEGEQQVRELETRAEWVCRQARETQQMSCNMRQVATNTPMQRRLRAVDDVLLRTVQELIHGLEQRAAANKSTETALDLGGGLEAPLAPIHSPVSAAPLRASRPDSDSGFAEKPRRNNHSTTQHGTLLTWFNEHTSNPYPTQAEKEALASQSQLEVRQVEHWFTNRRKRHWRHRERHGKRAKRPASTGAAAEYSLRQASRWMDDGEREDSLFGDDPDEFEAGVMYGK